MSSKTVHPVYVPTFPATGVELSCWAYITAPRLSPSQKLKHISESSRNQNQERFFPNLITAQGSTLRIYHYSPPLQSQKDQIHVQDSLHLLKTFTVSGMVCSLDTLPNARSRSSYIYDGLLIGFSGNPRLSIVHPELHHDYHLCRTSTTTKNDQDIQQPYQNHLHMERLQASSIIDLTPALFERCKGAMTPLDQDLYVSICHDHWKTQQSTNTHNDHGDEQQQQQQQQQQHEGRLQEEEEQEGTPSIAAIVLGGGVCVATFSFLKGPVPQEHQEDDEDLDYQNIVTNEEQLEEELENSLETENHDMDTDSNPISIDKQDVKFKKQSEEKEASHDWWLYASEPYIVDLHALSRSVASFRKSGNKYGSSTLSNKSQKDNPLENTNENTSFSSTWGEILSISFLTKYSSPTLAILHTSTSSTSSSSTPSSIGFNAGNTSSNNNKNASTASNGIWAGRMTVNSAFRHSCSVTALAISVEQSRSVVIWSTPEGTCPCDARFIKSIPKRGGCCVVSPNGILCIPHGGTIGSVAGNRPKLENSNESKVKEEIEQNAKGISVLACNGFAHATIAARKHPNPRPLPILNIHIDGCRLEFLSENIAVLVNRDGRVYSIELHSKSTNTNELENRKKDEPNTEQNEDDLLLSCAPLPYKMEEGACSTLSVLPLYRWTGIYDKHAQGQQYVFPMKNEKEKDILTADFQGIGLFFCGSRFGDSVLLAYHYEHIQFHPTLVDKPLHGMKRKLDNNFLNHGLQKTEEQEEMNRSSVRLKKDHESNESSSSPPETISSSIESKNAMEDNSTKNDGMNEDDELDSEARLRQEEMELYEGYTTAASPYTSSDSDDDSCSYDINALLAEAYANTQYIATTNKDGTPIKPNYHRPTINALTVFSTLTPIHTLSAPGPLGPSCRGPSYLPGEETLVMPCGYGPSGGVLMMHSIADGRNIKNEIDLRGVSNGWIFRNSGLILFEMNGNVSGKKAILMSLDQDESITNDQDYSEETKKSTNGIVLKEVSIDDSRPNGTAMETDLMDTPQKVYQGGEILAAREWCILSIPYLIHIVNTNADNKYKIVIMQQVQENKEGSKLQMVQALEFGKENQDYRIVSLTPFERFSEGLFFGCIWSNGQASLIKIFQSNATEHNSVLLWHVEEYPVPSSSTEGEVITAMDIFMTKGKEAFPLTGSVSEIGDRISSVHDPEPDSLQSGENIKVAKTEFDTEKFDAEDIELYGLPTDDIVSLSHKLFRERDQSHHLERTKEFLYVAISTSLNKLQVYDSSLDSLLWKANGSGHGLQKMSPIFNVLPTPEASINIIELRFFHCGELSLLESKDLCCAMLTNNYDLHVYRVSPSRFSKEEPTTLFRVSLGNCLTRPSAEEKRYRGKLARKGMLPNADVNKVKESFKKSKLHRFNNISRHCGLFASVWRPLWVVKCDSRIIPLYHKLRHVTPGGYNDVPISVFLEIGEGNTSKENKDGLFNEGFMTVHDRIGRVGSQRMTVYDGIFRLPSQKNNAIYPDGSGMLLTKIPYGVTVRQISFYDDPIFSNTTDPIFILLISKVLELDQSFLNDDGLTSEERQHLKEEREREKTRRQVEADLGGFDVEQEWVEEIEREDIFDVDTELGSAPKIQVEKHEVWLVRGGEEWIVLDQYELDNFEHGMTLKVMNLTDIEEDEGGTSSSGDTDEGLESPLYVTVGTGIVDKDGEDIGSKGRILLFEVKRRNNELDDRKSSIKLSMTYSKDILLGPVTSLNSLTCEGKSRVVLGAGAEVTVEQWGDGKLTQVGFFHANMQVQNIVLFKTFFLLSDAYDSLHFLVWRESDKSLTLLAKDYEPTAIFAAGTISRGGTLAFMCHDDRQNLQFFQYAPKDEASRGGNKLVCRADFHLGMQTIAMHSHWCKSSLLTSSSTLNSTLTAMKQQDPLFGHGDDNQRFAVYFGTTDGAISTVVPVSERIYWRMIALQSVLSNALESNCGLSHRAWRLYRRSTRRGGGRNNDRKKGVLDGSLLFQFLHLGIYEQEQLASAIGSTVDVILDNLLELDCASRMK